MWNYIKSEPAVVMGLVQAVMALVISFGFQLTPEQIGGILAVSAAVLAIVTRQSVTPNVNVLTTKRKGPRS